MISIVTPSLEGERWRDGNLVGRYSYLSTGPIELARRGTATATATPRRTIMLGPIRLPFGLQREREQIWRVRALSFRIGDRQLFKKGPIPLGTLEALEYYFVDPIEAGTPVELTLKNPSNVKLRFDLIWSVQILWRPCR